MINKNLVFWILVILIFCLGIYFVYFVYSESGRCIQNPLVYGVSKYKSTMGEFTCTCSSQNSGILFVTKDNMSLLNNYNNFLTG